MLEKKSADIAESGGGTPPGRRRRADRAIETRRRLIDAAASVVGAEGYANASVARITALADIAQGTFYNYFASQQDLFDQLLPELGAELIEFIRERIAGESDSFKREEIGFRAFFDFLAARPQFYRILNEAETFAPKAYHDHMRNMADGYIRALSRSHAKGELQGFERRELEVIIYTMLAARNYLSYRYLFRDGRPRRMPAWVDRAYMKLMTGGMLHGGSETPPRRGRRSTKSADDADLNITTHFRTTATSPGESLIEFETTDASLGPTGAIRQGVLLKLIEAAATAAVSEISPGSPRLMSLSSAFPHAAGREDLAAVARAEANGSAIYVSIELRAMDGAERVIATAQAVYDGNSATQLQNES